MAFKYFYYISKSKVEMLLPQVRQKRFSIASISPKVEIAGISIGGEVNNHKDEGLITNTVDLIDRLWKDDSIMPVGDAGRLKASEFYHSNDVWHHGLFYFKGGTPGGTPGFWGKKQEDELLVFTAIYLVWMTYGNSMILLVGSPNNILGEKVARNGIFVPGTSNAVHTVMDIADSLKADEPYEVTLRDNQGKVEITEDIKIEAEPYYADAYDGELPTPLVGLTMPSSHPLSLVFFCSKYLGNLPERQIDTVFRVFSEFRSSKRDYWLDLSEMYNAEIERVKRYPITLEKTKRRWETVMAREEFIELRKYNTVYIGSPVYTALA